MDLSLLAANADKDLEHFIKKADDVEFAKRFPGWFGIRKEFLYDRYEKGLLERRYQAQMKNKPDPFTARDCRRAYKIGMSKLKSELDKQEQLMSGEIYAEKNNLVSCLRCMLVKSGTMFIDNSTICSCSIIFYPNSKELTEDDLKQQLPDNNEEADYPATLAISTALSSVEADVPIGRNYPPAQMIKKRLLDVPHVFQTTSGHKCEAPCPQLKRDITLQLEVRYSHICFSAQ